MGVVLGESRQRVGVARSGLFDWADRTFPADDDRSFIGSLRDLELLLRVGWESPFPEKLDERSVLNVEETPEELIEALVRPPAALVQCTACRRLCVQDDFVWKERQLCAWDYHLQVFGKRGPWREGNVEPRHFESLPECSYVVEGLLEQVGVDRVLSLGQVPESVAFMLVRTLLENEPVRSYMTVRTARGLVVLRERAA
jgi:hypothetical protein